MGLDVARALAVLGMVGAHVGEAGSFELLDPSSWAGIVHGRSSILFAVLAGVSIALMTGRHAPLAKDALPQARLRLLGRGAAIFLIGILLELLNTPIAVILTVYGILYVAVIPFLGWSVRRLLIASAVLAVAGPPLLAGLQAVLLAPSAPGLDLVLFGTYPITVWLAFVLAGMALGRLRPERIRTAVGCLVAGVVLCAAGAGLGALGHLADDDLAYTGAYDDAASFSWTDDGVGGYGVPADDLDFTGKVCDDFGDGWVTCYPEDGGEASFIEDPAGSEFGDEGGWASYLQQVADAQPLVAMRDAITAADPHSGGTAEILGSGGFALAVIAVCLLLSRPLRWVLLPFAALGSMPLTAYSAHVVSVFVMAAPMGMVSGDAVWGICCIALLVLTTLWAMLFGRGPLERLVGRAAEAMAGSGAAAGSRRPLD